MTRGEALRHAVARLAAAGVATPGLDARVLVSHVLGLDHAGLIASSDRPASADDRSALAGAVARRISGEPVARILARREFWGLDFALGSETLVPRPESETIVEAALDAVGDRARVLSVLDLGVGSGCLLLAALSELPGAEGIGVDRSFAAVAVAGRNACALGLAKRARFAVGDWAAALGGTFDLILSNPPYIASGDVAGLDVEVRAHDPMRALDGGPDGLDAYRAILDDLPRVLAPDGVAVLELGAGQEEAVARHARTAGLEVAGPARADLSGTPRALTLRKPRQAAAGRHR